MAKKAADNKPAMSNPAVARVITAYHDGFLARFGFKPRILGGKDGALLKGLLATWPEDEVLALLVEFLRTTDPRILRSDYTLAAFCGLAQYLRLRTHRTDDKTAHNVDAAMKAIGRR